MAKLSTWPVLNRWKILSPQAPIVITNYQTVRTSDSGDAAQAAAQVKSKLSTLVLVNGGTVTVVGSAVNLTSDGSFVGALASFSGKQAGVYMVVLGDGTSAPLTQTATDSATSLVFFKAALNNVPVPSLGDSAAAAVGDKIFFVQNSLQDYTARVGGAMVQTAQGDVEGQVSQSDYPRRGFYAPAGFALALGEAAVDQNGNLMGIWNGNVLISADVLKTAMALYYGGQSQVIRPAFGFSYQIITQNDSKLSGSPQGAMVKSVLPFSAARLAGLLPDDIIVSASGQAITQTSPLEPILEAQIPGSSLSLSVSRGKQTLALTLTAGKLK